MPLPMHPRGPINIDIWCYRKLPLTWFVANDRERGLRNQQMLNSHTPNKSTPDADNLAKFMCDAINGVVHADDRQIARIRITKTFHTTPPFTGKTAVKFKRVVHSFGERCHNNWGAGVTARDVAREFAIAVAIAVILNDETHVVN